MWNSTPSERHKAPISASGWMTPISLCAAITETRSVLSESAASNAASETQAVRLDRQIGDAEALALELEAAFEHAFVLGCQGYDVIAGLARSADGRGRNARHP